MGSVRGATYLPRLLPNQDVLPEGDFGNLIAAPLQGRRRRDGLTTFLDLGTLEPYADQWAFLSALDRLSPADAERVARQAKLQRIEQFLGIRAGQLGGGRRKLTGAVDIALLPSLARVAHVDALTAMLAARGHQALVLHGAMSTTDRRTAVDRLGEAKAGDGLLVIGTTPFIGEGFDARP